MKRLSVSIFALLSIFVVAISSCDLNQEEQQPPEADLDLSKLDLSGLKMDFTRVIDLNEHSLEDIAEELQDALTEVDYEEMAMRMGLAENMEAYLEMSLLVDEKENTATLIVTEQFREKSDENGRILQTDNEKCGGQNGDGWTVLDNRCLSSDCVAAAILAGADQLGEPGSGECLDFRVVGLLAGARVCRRKISC
ncbi:hypothetical protein [Algoriphagus sediminis]|uniref:Lipoprotein n=1 Tax=Algoriphagus sediminis TaxID=3057113 RepID=A0ABT7Y9Y7_9BACT|nr:hypothetical protein [Algoriphagus sediminis]MDN3203235.1 hypothetical protein [Algoriphagus sediminis]